MNRRPFTPDEDAIIIRDYARRMLKEIATDLGRDPGSVQARAALLLRDGRLTGTRCYQPPWTEAEDDLLADLWGTMPDAAVAKRVGRSVVACEVRAKRHLRLARKDAFLTSRQVARILGVDDHLVVCWIAEGLLQGRKSSVGAGGHARAWRIDDRDLERFLKRDYWRLDRRRIEVGTYWRNYVDRLWTREPYLTVEQAARALGVGPETVRRHLRRGWLAGVRTHRAARGGRIQWLIARSQLAAFRPRHPLAVMLDSVADQNRRRRSA